MQTQDVVGRDAALEDGCSRARSSRRLLILVDIERVMRSPEIGLIDTVATKH